MLAKAAMSSHLKSCRRKAAGAETPPKTGKRQKVFHLVVEGRYASAYWMHLEIPADATLATLDRFLRDIWLECCGHLSEFQIEGRRFSVEPMDYDDGFLDEKLQDVLEPGVKFEYTYDFGSSTYLRLRVAAEIESTLKRDEVRVLARNEPPVIPCDECGKPATQVCTVCMYAGEGWLCDECAARHDCDDPMFLPVVNSPRVGVCGYAG